jgi:hypothetical protein
MRWIAIQLAATPSAKNSTQFREGNVRPASLMQRLH